MARSATRQEAVDPDRATGKTSVRVQVVDHGLGLLLLGLVARYSQHLSENLELVPVAIGSLAATVTPAPLPPALPAPPAPAPVCSVHGLIISNRCPSCPLPPPNPPPHAARSLPVPAPKTLTKTLSL